MAKEILIADSDKTEQEELRRVFEMTDYKLVFSENGEDALLRVRLFKPDLIIAQVGLREKSGLELCQAVKTDSEFKDIPFILLTGIFEEISEKDRVRAGVDGVISKPLGEEEILSLVDQMFEEKRDGKIRRETTKQEKGWSSLSDMDKPRLEGKEDFLLDGFDEENEEIIDLLEVVEEPESKMSIDDFITPVKTEPFRDIAPLESWDKPLEEEMKPVETPSDEAFDFSIEEEKETGPRVDLKTETETSPEEELFEKIELEEILEKVEQLKPSIEKEWPLDAEIDKKIEEALPGPELETTEKWMNLRDFESALKAGVKGEEEAEPRVEDELQPLTMKEPKAESREEGQQSVALAEFQPFSLEEPREEESLKPAESMEDEIQSFIRKEFGKGAPLDVSSELTELSTPEIGTPPAIEKAESIELALEEEALSELPKEEFAEALIEELEEEEIGAFEEPAAPKEQEISIFREEKPPDFLHEMETQSFIQEVQPSISEQEAPKTFLEEVRPQPRVLDRQMEEVIGKGVQEMMEGFITKVLPELTQSILNLTVERIEKMVKEIVPDLVEKAIREEILRIQKGDKD
jgi:CheY-like chemotaxis protein